jgi:hypothetical protein
MPLAFILIPLLGLLGTLFTAHWGAAELFGFFLLLAVFVNLAVGGWQPCPKCGSRLTTQLSEQVPDFSGHDRMHTWTWQKCWNPRCRKKVGLRGVFAEQKHTEEGENAEH